MNQLARPSGVTGDKYIRIPEWDPVDSDEEWDRCGKWMLNHPHADLRFVDSAWTKLQQLLDDGTNDGPLLMLKASTAKMAKDGATVLCFTRPGKREAKRAARAIREVVNFSGNMFYKLNKQTSQGIDNRFGDKNVSVYMHTFFGMFYARKNGCWIEDVEDDAKKIPIARKFFKENYSGNEGLPSTSEKNHLWEIPENHQYYLTGNSNWYMFCSCEEDGDGYLSQADRVWLVAKELVEEGQFVGITCMKKDDVRCEVRLYLSHRCDVHSRLTALDRIFGDACCRTVMYFADDRDRRNRHQEGRILHSYEYTSGGELYRVTDYGSEHVFL